MREYDVIVIGAGHAGIEASLACARLGMKTAVFTITLDNIGVMSCQSFCRRACKKPSCKGS